MNPWTAPKTKFECPMQESCEHRDRMEKYVVLGVYHGTLIGIAGTTCSLLTYYSVAVIDWLIRHAY